MLRVDDSADTVESSAALIRLSGHEVRTARSGPEALALLDGWDPDVAVLDLMMPGMDGYELARRLCGRPGGRRNRVVRPPADSLRSFASRALGDPATCFIGR